MALDCNPHGIAVNFTLGEVAHPLPHSSFYRETITTEEDSLVLPAATTTLPEYAPPDESRPEINQIRSPVHKNCCAGAGALRVMSGVPVPNEQFAFELLIFFEPVRLYGQIEANSTVNSKLQDR
jgi:hypothetical protein